MVLRIHYLILFCTTWMMACTQPSPSTSLSLVTDTITYQLGATPVTLLLRTYKGHSPLFYIHL
ncbi:MAG TPA: hypothetical protein VD794_17040, partial [Flavisolibacter sp.]|nr:hypothetical protein [Flavisolibacter sp.]